MKLHIHNKRSFLPWVAMILFFASCKKFVDIDPPPTKIETSNIFLSDQSATSAVIGLYSNMLRQSLIFCNGGTTVYAGLSADEIVNTSASAVPDALRTNTLTPNTGTLPASLWNAPYNLIYHANAVLEGLSNSTSLTDSVKKQLMGEMLVARAFFYFYLLNLYGDVPYPTTTNYEVNAVMPRTQKTIIYHQMTADLIKAKDLLKTIYPPSNRVRPNKWTATALLARVYLYTGDWVNAEAQANAIIASGIYSLSALSSVFTSITSNETIWQLIKDNSNTAEGGTFIPSTTTSRPTYVLTPSLYNAFQAGDQRKTAWVGTNVVLTPAPSTTYYYPAKYKEKQATTPVKEYYIVFRLAEQYLIRAEARAQQGNLTGANSAASDINSIRSRAGLGTTPATTQAQILAAIEQERRVELFAEWGHRWFDLIRTARAGAVLDPIKYPKWESTDVLYPIWQNEMNLNPYLVQNPGY
jgi:hypothetical protein